MLRVGREIDFGGNNGFMAKEISYILERNFSGINKMCGFCMAHDVGMYAYVRVNNIRIVLSYHRSILFQDIVHPLACHLSPRSAFKQQRVRIVQLELLYILFKKSCGFGRDWYQPMFSTFAEHMYPWMASKRDVGNSKAYQLLDPAGTVIKKRDDCSMPKSFFRPNIRCVCYCLASMYLDLSSDIACSNEMGLFIMAMPPCHEINGKLDSMYIIILKRNVKITCH